MPHKSVINHGLFARIFTLFISLSLLASFGFAQPVCSVTSTSPQVHADGLAERVGDITLNCTGGTAGATASLTVFVSLSTNISNRLDSDGNLVGISLTGASGTIRSSSATTLNIGALNYTIPAPSSTPVIITISGIRAAVAMASGAPFINAALIGVGATFPPGLSLVVATPINTLLASTLNNGVPCNGSPLPSVTDFPGFVSAPSAFSTVRVTEASPNAFTPMDVGADSGLRFKVNLTGYGTGTRVFVPDVIVGNSGSTPTSAGAFGYAAQGGTYTPGVGQLLLIRVNDASANGAGGKLAAVKPVVVTNFTSMSEISLSGGAGYVVYEVVESGAAVVETAQIPVFTVVNQTSCPSTLAPQLAVSPAPVSTVAVSTATDPIPRFIASVPPSDCQQLNDCGASYFPKLQVDTTPVVLSGSSRGLPQTGYVRVGNAGSGVLNFTTSVDYQSGSGWLSLSPSSGSNNITIQAVADPTNLGPGTYNANIKVDAGAYGSGSVPVTFTVGPIGVVLTNVGNAASFQYGTVAPGSYAVLYGLNMAGNNVSVTFNNLPATIIYKSDKQLNVIVPNLSAPQAANVVVTVDGQVSPAFKVNLALNSPGIFTPGIVNFKDGAVNDAGHPASRGDFVIVYFTGLAVPVTPGTITVNIGGLTGQIPAFAGPQGLPALDQVNFVVPASLPAGTNPVPFQVCAPGSTGQQSCSNTVNLYVQ